MKDIEITNELVSDERIFKLDAFLATHTGWEKYGLRELKAIAVIYSSINPEWKELRPMNYTASEFNKKLGLNTKLGYKEMLTIFKNIKAVVHEGAYKPSSNNPESLMPVTIRIYSLIGSAETVVNQDEENDYIPSIQEASIAFDEHIIDNILFAKNAVKDKNNDVIGGVGQYFACKESDILEFREAKALRLFLTLFRYNGVSVKMSFEELCKKVGVKTQAPNKQTVLRSAMSDGPKIDKTRKKFYDFKSRTLNKMVDEINRCTGMGLTYSEKISRKKDGTSEISIKFNIPKYREDMLYPKINKSIIKNNTESKEPIDDSTYKENTVLEDNSKTWFEEGFNCFSDLNDNNSNINNNHLTEQHVSDINGLHTIYGSRVNMTLNEVEKIYIENNKDAIKTNKVLESILNKKNDNSDDRLDRVLTALMKYKKKPSDKDIKAAKELVCNFNIEEIIPKIHEVFGNKDNADKGYNLGYIQKIIESKSNNIKKIRHIGFKECNITGTEMKKRIEEQMGTEGIADFDYIFGRK